MLFEFIHFVSSPKPPLNKFFRIDRRLFSIYSLIFERKIFIFFVEDGLKVFAKFESNVIAILANSLKIVQLLECPLFGKLLREYKSILKIFLHFHLGNFDKGKMNLKLLHELWNGLRCVINLVVVAKHLFGRFEVLAKDFEANGFEGAEGDKHDIIGIILINNLALLTGHCLFLMFCGRGVAHKI